MALFIKLRRMGPVCIAMIVVSMLLMSSVVLAAAKPETSLESKRDSLHNVAYYVIDAQDGDSIGQSAIANLLYNSDLERKLAAMNDQEINDLMRRQVSAVIAKKANGDFSIRWDEAFVAKVVKQRFPDLYEAAYKQLVQDNQLTTEAAYATAAFTPGNRTRTFSIYAYHWTGYTLWGFFSRVYWAWNATEITQVYPTTYGEVYDPSWSYLGIVGNSQYFVSPTRFHLWKEGHFGWPVGSPIQINRYPWLDIDVYAGGSSSYTSGGAN